MRPNSISTPLPPPHKDVETTMTYGNNSGSRASPLAVLGCIGIAAILVIAIAVGGYVFFGDRLGTDSSVAAEGSADDTGDDGDTEEEGTEEDADGDADNSGGEGNTVQVENLSFTLDSVTPGIDTITGHDRENVPAGQYVAIEVTAENTGDQEEYLSSSMQALVDTDGIEYEMDIPASTDHMDDPGDSPTLNPGETGDLTLVYDIPDDAEPGHMLVSDHSVETDPARLDVS